MPRTTDLPKAKIVRRYAAGESIQTLASAYGRSFGTMRENLHRWGAVMRRRGPPRTYTLNEQFFDNVETELQAYWLGFILADGRTAPTEVGNWITRVDLAAADYGHLVKLAAAVGSDAPIHSGHEGASCYLDLCSVKLCKRLVQLECSPTKTGSHGTPIVPSRLLRHFYRGYSDGDGSLYEIKEGPSWRYDAIGPYRFVQQYQDWLIVQAGVNRTKLIRADCKTEMWCVRYTGGPQIVRIANLLYAGASVVLDRKQLEYCRLLESRECCV